MTVAIGAGMAAAIVIIVARSLGAALRRHLAATEVMIETDQRTRERLRPRG